MPFTANGYYNNPQLGQAMTNIASLFAPPTFQEQLAGATLQQARDTAAAKTAALGRLQTQYPGIKGLADLYTGGDSDPVVHAGKLAQLQAAIDNPNNMSVQDPLNYANTGTVAGTITGKAMEPISTDQVRYTPAMATGAAGPTTQYGVLKNGDRTTLLPNGMLPSLIGAPAPASADDSTDDATPAASTITPTATTPGGAAISNAKPVGAAAPDNGVSVASNGITTIDSPDKAAKAPTIEQIIAAHIQGLPLPQQGAVLDKLVDAKIAGSGTNINVNTAKDDQNYADGAMKSLGAQHYALANGVSSAQAQLRDVNAMEGALNRIQAAGGGTGLGTSEKVKLQGVLNTAAQSLGITEPFNVDDPQIITKFNRTLAGAQAKEVGGARVTNFDLNNFIQSNPGLDVSTGANKTLLGIQRQLAQRQIDLGNSVRQYYAQSFRDRKAPDPSAVEAMISAYDNANHIKDPVSGQDLTVEPRLPGASAPTSGAPDTAAAPVAIKTVDDYNALPAGSTYINPSDGSVRTKR